MGVVWQGIHRAQAVPVAVKVLTLQGSQDPLYLASLRNEVRRVAGLDHPAVVRVFDQGVLPQSVSTATGGELSPGSPYLVMELLEGGTLLPLCGRLGWAQVWRILVRILEGLAHAHARGVVHRDIKPSNILLRRQGAGVTLVDFGLARAGDQERGGSAFLDVGTPGYMAPEQIRRQWRDIGPWTDLYAVGCVATALVSARPPFVGESAEEVLQAHLDQPVPELAPLCEVPDGFEAWIGRLLEKSHHLRFGRAADAIHALKMLVDEADDQVEIVLAPLSVGDPLMNSATTDLRQLGEITDGPLMEPSDTAVMDHDLRSGFRASMAPAPMPELLPPLILSDLPQAPPVQSGWRDASRVRQSLRLLGTGLGIFGLRDLPIIGRQAEQDLLWGLFHETLDSGSGRAVVLSGGAGSGRSHLARWLSQRTHEVGAASVHWVTVEKEASAAEVLAPICHQILKTIDMDREHTHVRAAERLSLLGSQDTDEVDAIVALLGPYEGEGDTRDVEFERAKARYVIVRRLLQRKSTLRPVILVLDEAHESKEALEFARHMLRAQEYAPHPILILLTVGGPGVSVQSQTQLEEFMALDGVTNVLLKPLATEDRELLVREILGLNQELAAIVARRSGGNPQFAVQLVGDWVQKGLLEVGKGGFRMRPGVKPEIPEDLQAMWARRLAAVISADREVGDLELAARMGLDVDPETWEEACAVLGLSADWDLVDQLLSAQLAMPGPTLRSWRFGHYLLADALIRRADFGGRAMQHHAAAAEVLSRRDESEVAIRLGRHQVGAGMLEQGVSTLHRAARGCIDRSEWNRAWALLVEREGVMRKLQLPHSDHRWAEGWLARAEAKRAQNDLEIVVDLYNKVLQCMPADSQWAVQALVGLGRVERIRGNHHGAREIFLRAMDSFEGTQLERAPVLIQLGILEATYGDVGRARELYEQVLQLGIEAEDGDLIQEVRFHMAGLFRRMGDEEGVRAALTQVRDWCKAHGRRERVAQCANDLAEVDRLHGNVDAAITGYREALRLYEAVGARQVYVARTNLGIISAERGHTVEARDHMERVVPMLQRMQLRGIEGLAQLVLVLVEVQDHRWEVADEALSRGVSLLEETGFVDVDVARALEQSGEVALEAGQIERSRVYLELSEQHWVALEREEEAARVADMLAEIQEID